LLKSILLSTGLLLACFVSAVRPGTRPVRMQSGGRTVQSAAPVQPVSTHRALLDRYCVSCHSEKLATANLMLDKLDVAKVDTNGALWEKVVHKLRTGAMPPPDKPRPDASGYRSLITYLETELDRTAEAKSNPGRPAIHRLNRLEYTNAIRDLLGVNVDGESLLPIDEVQYGFDNNADVLSLTPVLMERYMAAARKISRLAVGEAEVAPVSEKYEIHKFLMQDDRVSEDLPFGSRGGIAVRYHFPIDGEYTIRVFLQRNSRNYIRGLAEPHPLDFRLDGERIKLVTVGGGDELKGRPGPPFSQAALIGDDPSEVYENGGAETNLEVRFRAKAGERVVAVTFLKRDTVREGAYRRPLTQFQMVQYKGDEPSIDNIVIGGPYNAGTIADTPSRQRIFVCRPTAPTEEAVCARKILSTLGRRAYRRPVTEKDLQNVLRVYETERKQEGFESGIRAAVERILAGPEFLFRIERDPAGVPPDTAYRISDLELASRLSFFLWSTIPDDELLSVAESGKLKDPVVLDQQVRRMLADPRSRTLVTNFAEQWLYLRNIRSKTPDPKLFPGFNENLRDAFLKETQLFLETAVREDQSILRLLDADYTFLNEQLARHYGIPNVYGSHFRRVTLGPEFDARRGLLGHGSLLTVNSYANRTSVVLRGKWLLENILGSPPPPPPPNVPSLDESATDGRPLPLRQLMESHRKNAACANCHAPMDPLGFALENFDATGAWRTSDGDTQIDSSAVLPDGTKFDGPSGLRKVLLNHPEDFAGVVADRMLTYALGRGLEYYDMPVIRKIVREAARQDYRWSSLILATIKSMPFQMRRSQKL
jgi:hypothetical protein